MSPSRCSQANTCSVYKPVPPPKPFAGQPHQLTLHQENQGTDMPQHIPNGVMPQHIPNGVPSGYPHILVTEQGHFITHSTKFPIVEEKEKLLSMHNENARFSQGIDNPALINDPATRGVSNSLPNGDQGPYKDMAVNHYAPMRTYDSSKHASYLQSVPQPNRTAMFGHPQHHQHPQQISQHPQHIQQPQHSQQQQQHLQQQQQQQHTPQQQHPQQQQLQQHNQQTTNPSISVQSASTNWGNRLQPNTCPPHSLTNSPDKRAYTNGNQQLSLNGCVERPYYLPPQPQSMTMRGSDFEQGNYVKDHQGNNIKGQLETFVNHNERSLQLTHVQLNGGTNLCNNNYPNGIADKNRINNQSENATINFENENFENKKDEKWGSLKKAGQKYSQFKNILSNKFVKADTKSNDNENTSSPTQNKGTNSQNPKIKTETEVNSETAKSERLHNGENQMLENKNFQRVVTYSSLKARLDDPRQDPPMYVGPERQSNRMARNGVDPCPPYDSQAHESWKQRENLASKRAGSCSHLGLPVTEPKPIPSWSAHHRSDDNLTRALPSDQSYPDHGIGASTNHLHSVREGRASGGSDSGRGTGGSGNDFKGHDTSLESGSTNRNHVHGQSSGNESEWIDITESEIKRPPYRTEAPPEPINYDGAATPPLPPLSPEGTPKTVQRMPSKSRKLSHSFSSRGAKKPDLLETTEQNGNKVIHSSSASHKTHTHMNGNVDQGNLHRSTSLLPSSVKGWTNRDGNVRAEPHVNSNAMMRLPPHSFPAKEQQNIPQSKKFDQANGNRGGGWRAFESGDDDDELTSTDALDLNSVLDGATEITTDDEFTSTRGDDAYLIQRQLEGLEGMYSEVLKVLGGRRNPRHNDIRPIRRRLHGSMSSLPSSVMSGRPIRDKKGRVIDDRLRRASKDSSKQTTHKRFQRLESHVVTLARSVAHLSSEMRTQHLMLQEMESIRSDLSALKVSRGKSDGPVPPYSRGVFPRGNLWNTIGTGGPALSNPGRVKKLTQFFGDEPPLVRIFLRKLGYEKYANIFEQEKIGMLELPYMTEERLQKIGIPLGPRLRILQEAQGPIQTEGNLSVYVV